MQAILWLVLMLLFLAVESGTVALVSIWFSVGALAALVVSFFTSAFWIQAVVFLAVSCVFLAMLRPLVRKFITPKLVKTNLDSIIGSVGTVVEDIDNLQAAGQVKLGAMTWTARSANDAPISKGTFVRVERIEGVKLIVVPAEVTANLS